MKAIVATRWILTRAELFFWRCTHENNEFICSLAHLEVILRAALAMSSFLQEGNEEIHHHDQNRCTTHCANDKRLVGDDGRATAKVRLRQRNRVRRGVERDHFDGSVGERTRLVPARSHDVLHQHSSFHGLRQQTHDHTDRLCGILLQLWEIHKRENDIAQNLSLRRGTVSILTSLSSCSARPDKTRIRRKTTTSGKHSQRRSPEQSSRLSFSAQWALETVRSKSSPPSTSSVTMCKSVHREMRWICLIVCVVFLGYGLHPKTPSQHVPSRILRRHRWIYR